METTFAFHGGRSFEAIGEDFRTLDRAAEVVNADVLDAWFDPSPRVIDKLQRFLPFLLRTSPPAHARGLVEAIAEARGVEPDCVLTGGGSSDLIFTLLPRLLDAGSLVMILDPMYGEYRHIFGNVLGLDLLRFPLRKENQFRIDTDALIASIRAHQPDVVALVNPNSPSGQHWKRQDVIRFLDSIPENVRVVMDETYIEYVGAAESIEREARMRANVIVIKSMSKVYALSGARVAYMISNRETIRNLARWMPPWAVSLPAQAAAVEALQDPVYYAERYAETAKYRALLLREIQKMEDITVYPSVANFLLLEVPFSARQVVESMAESNVFVRNCDSMSDRFRDRFVRIAVKCPTQNRRIVRALAQCSVTSSV